MKHNSNMKIIGFCLELYPEDLGLSWFIKRNVSIQIVTFLYQLH